MNGFLSVFKREFKSYFATPVAYVFLVIFLAAAPFLAFQNGAFFKMGQANMQSFFQFIPMLFVFMVPSTAMRMWAEERNSGSIELLFTLPITVGQAVLGKFMAAWAFLTIALLLTFPFPIAVASLGNPDWGLIITGYLGSFLLAGSFLAIGSFFSAISKNQVISFILTVVVLGILLRLGMPTTLSILDTFLPNALLVFVEAISIQIHFDSMLRGVIELKDILFFIGLICGALYANMLLLDERKAA
jgi:ABC-2 type transport system permease protein